MELTIRSLERDDEPAMSRLYEEVHGRQHSDAWLDWKFFQNPAGEHDSQLAFDGDRLVGVIGIRPVQMVIEEEQVAAGHICDVMILEDYRKRTPFFRLCKQATDAVVKRGQQFVFGTSVEDTYRISTKLLGFVTAGPIRRQMKVLNPSPFLRYKLRFKALSEALGILLAGALRVVYLPWMRTASGITVRELDEFDQRFEELWIRRRRDYNIMAVRDLKYLVWRYKRNPAQKYKIFSAERNGVLEGFVVVCLRDENMRRGYLVDLLAPPGDTDVIRSLIVRAIRYCKQEKAHTVSAWWLEHTSAHEISRKMGFLSLPTNHHLIVRTHGPRDNEYLSKRTRWYFTMGDTDHY